MLCSRAVVLALALFVADLATSQNPLFTMKLLDEDEVKKQSEFREEIRRDIRGITTTLNNLKTSLTSLRHELERVIASSQEATESSLKAMLADKFGRLFCNEKENHRLYNDSCYYFSTTTRNWTNALEFCRQMKGDLVKLSSEKEFEFLGNMNNDSWIGLSHCDEDNTLRWSVDKTIYEMGSHPSWWAPNRPTDSPVDNCTVLHASSSQLDYATCESEYGFICEIDPQNITTI